MAEDIKALIEKIQQEGVQAAEDKAREIENEARRKAAEIIAKARQEAAGIVAEGKKEVARLEASTQASLEQAGRDLLLTLKKEIMATLDRLITSGARETLKPEELSRIITALIASSKGREKEEITVLLNKNDLAGLEKDFFGGLRAEAKKGITLKPSEDIHAGFLISYDGGKSHFDFTDKALAEYIGSYLNPKLAKILKC